MACRTLTCSSDGLVAACLPAVRSSLAPGCETATEPSTTDTSEPAAPLETAKTVPLTDATVSRVTTRRWPRRCFAACTMTSPRSSRMVCPLHAACTESSVRWFNSTREPSVSNRTAREPAVVRTTSRADSEAAGFSELAGEVGAELRPELGAGERRGAGNLSPHAVAGGGDLLGRRFFFAHFL